MGGGISSLSKVCILAPSERDNADLAKRVRAQALLDAL